MPNPLEGSRLKEQQWPFHADIELTSGGNATVVSEEIILSRGTHLPGKQARPLLTIAFDASNPIGRDSEESPDGIRWHSFPKNKDRSDTFCVTVEKVDKEVSRYIGANYKIDLLAGRANLSLRLHSANAISLREIPGDSDFRKELATARAKKA